MATLKYSFICCRLDCTINSSKSILATKSYPWSFCWQCASARFWSCSPFGVGRRKKFHGISDKITLIIFTNVILISNYIWFLYGWHLRNNFNLMFYCLRLYHTVYILFDRMKFMTHYIRCLNIWNDSIIRMHDHFQIIGLPQHWLMLYT